MAADVANIRENDNLPVLAEDPSALPLNILMDECRSVYESRNEIVAGATIDEAREGLRRAMAIEQYVTLKGHKDEARRAARVLETAVGEALGEAQWGGDRRSDQPARAPVETAIDERDRHRFRLMATHRDLWWPVLAEKALSRNQVLTMIAETVEAATAQEITGRTARVILADCMDIIADLHVDLLIADPPYFTDGDFTRHVSACLKRVKPTGQAYIFASADPAEVAAYIAVDPGPMVLSQMLVWNYNNTGQRQPNDRYTSNYQMVFYYRGEGAPRLNKPADGTHQYACQTVNAPDGRRGDRWHRWQKPAELLSRLIRNSSTEGDLVFDPFVGTGTTVLAAAALGRKALGCDIDQDAIDICIKRGCVDGH